MSKIGHSPGGGLKHTYMKMAGNGHFWPYFALKHPINCMLIHEMIRYVDIYINATQGPHITHSMRYITAFRVKKPEFCWKSWKFAKSHFFLLVGQWNLRNLAQAVHKPEIWCRKCDWAIFTQHSWSYSSKMRKKGWKRLKGGQKHTIHYICKGLKVKN